MDCGKMARMNYMSTGDRGGSRLLEEKRKWSMKGYIFKKKKM